MENELSKQIDRLIEILKDVNVTQKMKLLIESGEWENISVFLMFHMALVMVRLPKVKENILSNNCITSEVKQVFYKELIWGREEAERLAERLFDGENLETIRYVIRKEERDGGINILMNYLVNNYYIEIYSAPANKKFYLIDNPVIVNDISDIDHFLPLSPEFALATPKIN